MGDPKKCTVSGIATLLLWMSAPSCGGSQEYVDSPDAMRMELGQELSRQSELPMARTARSQVRVSSMIRESEAVIRIAGVRGDRIPLIDRVSSAFESSHPGIQVRIFDPNSDQALQELRKGTVDLMLTTRPLSYGEKRQGLRQEILTVKTWIPIVHARNPLFDISREQLLQVLSGKIDHWSALGKHSASVERVIVQDEGSGQCEAWKSLYPEADLEPRGAAVDSWIQVAHRVTQERGAIALVPLGGAPSTGIKVLSVEGKHANYQTLGDKSYPLSYEVYVTYRVDASMAALQLKDGIIRSESPGQLRAGPGR